MLIVSILKKNILSILDMEGKGLEVKFMGGEMAIGMKGDDPIKR